MLVLSRKSDESIVIGDNIRVTVIRIHGNRIRLGIEAPPEVPIRRSEVQRVSQPSVANRAGSPDRIAAAKTRRMMSVAQ